MPGKIFVNYRRDDVPGDARGVRDGLATKFGKSSIFMDVDNLLVGQRFDLELAKALDDCDMLLAVMGPRWLDLLKTRVASGERDYVREEIAEALKRRIAVVPVRVGRDGSMPALPSAEELPEDIRELLLYQKHDVAHERFGRDMVELVAAVVALRKATSGGAKPSTAARVPWGWVGATAASVLAIGYSVAYYSGVPVPWPSARPADTRLADPATRAKADDEARARAAEVERLRVAAVKDEDERKRIEAEAATSRADAAARRKADDEARAKAAAAADANRKAEEAERRRLAALKAEEDRKRAEGEERANQLAKAADRSARDREVREKAASNEAQRKASELASTEAAVWKADEEARRIAALNHDTNRVVTTREPELPPQAPKPEPAAATVLGSDDRERLIRDIQEELKRVGCYSGDTDGLWGANSRGAVTNFSRSSGAGLASDEPNLSLLRLLRTFAPRVCPLQCAEGQAVRDGFCVPLVRPARLQPKELVKPKVDSSAAARQRAEQRAVALEKERKAAISRSQIQRAATPSPSTKSVPMCFPEHAREGGFVRCDDPRALR